MKLRQLSASVGAGVLCSTGVLFGQETSEAIGVQNVINMGTSGGPLISMYDEPGRFMGIGIYHHQPQLMRFSVRYCEMSHYQGSFGNFLHLCRSSCGHRKLLAICSTKLSWYRHAHLCPATNGSSTSGSSTDKRLLGAK
jgi:hypothetical protein